MPWLPILIVMVLVLVFGSAIALYWWGIAARIAPYQDEVERQRAREQAAKQEEVHVIVMPTGDKQVNTGEPPDQRTDAP